MIKKIVLLLMCANSMLAMEVSDELPKTKYQKLETAKVFQPPSLRQACILSAMKLIFTDKLEDVVVFLSTTCLEMEDAALFDLIDGIIEHNGKHRMFDQTTLILELAQYCVLKSMTLQNEGLEKVAADDISKTQYLLEMSKKEPGNQCPYAKKANSLLDGLLQDSRFTDKAVLQPLTALWLAERKLLGRHNGYAAMRAVLMTKITLDDFIHTICQLIIHNEQEALALVQLAQSLSYTHETLQRPAVIEQLWHWADLFARDSLVNYLEKFLSPEKLAALMQVPKNESDYFLSQAFQRALYAGDVERLSVSDVGFDTALCITDPVFFSRRMECPLLIAAQLGYTKVVTYLLQCVNEDSYDEEELQEVRQRALAYGHAEILKLLHKKDTVCLSEIKKQNTLHALTRAAMYGHTHAIQYALSHCDITMLSYLVCQSTGMLFKLLPMLLDFLEGSALEKEHKEQIMRHALCVALACGKFDSAKHLIERSMPLNGAVDLPKELTDDFLVPLEGTLLERVARSVISCESEEPLLLLKLMLKKGAQDEPDKDGQTLLLRLLERADRESHPQAYRARLVAVAQILSEAHREKRSDTKNPN